MTLGCVTVAGKVVVAVLEGPARSTSACDLRAEALLEPERDRQVGGEIDAFARKEVRGLGGGGLGDCGRVLRLRFPLAGRKIDRGPEVLLRICWTAAATVRHGAASTRRSEDHVRRRVRNHGREGV